MEIINVPREALLLDSVEKGKLLECMKYCSHRLGKHPGSELQVNISFVEYMIAILRGGEF